MNETMQTISDEVIPSDATNTVAQEDGYRDTEQDKMFSFHTARTHLERIINEWKTEVTATEERRKLRKVDVNVKEERANKRLDPDETLIPVRTIESNISKEQPPYVNYLINSRRLCVFNCISDPDQDAQLLENEFTRGMTYTDWVIPFYKCIDGSQAHGSACVEVVYDEKKPLNVGIEYIPHDELYYPMSVRDLQDSPRIIRKYEVTLTKLKKWVRDFDFDAEQVSMLSRVKRDTTKENETICIYKCFFKMDGVVYVAWFCLEHGLNNWLKAPAKHYIGIANKVKTQVPNEFGMMTEVESWQDADVDVYPVVQLPYRESEEVKISEYKGRCYLDANKQEAQTAILSAFVNGVTRASNVYASPDTQDDGTGSSLKELDKPLVPGRITNKPINFWHPDYPDYVVIQSLQYLDNQNSQETNQVNFAAMNREDSRKTAKEISSSEQQQSALNSVQLTLFSSFIRKVYNLVWKIVQSQALQTTPDGKSVLPFLLVKREVPVTNPIDGTQVIDPETQQPLTRTFYENNYEVIAKLYDVRAAGDIDVIQRQQKIMLMKQDWPVVANTPLKDQFLADLMKLQYPDVGERYAKILESGSLINVMQSLIMRLGTVLQGFIQQNQDDLMQMDVNARNDLMQLMQQTQQFMQSVQQPQQVK